MARKKIDINIRLQRQEKNILELTDQLNVAKDEYEKLQEAYEKSRRSFDEVMDFLKGKADI